MRLRIYLMASCSLVMLLCACYLKPQYPTLEAQLEDERSQNLREDQKMEYLQNQLTQTEEALQRMAAKLKTTREAGADFEEKFKELQIQYDYLKDINLQQAENIKTLRLELHKRKSVIELQEKVIQLLDDTKKTIETSLKDQIAAQQVEVVEADNKLKVIIVDKILFDSGSAEISTGGKELLKVMARSFQENKNQNIVIEGHTDNVALSSALTKKFPSNWELSTARAAAVAGFFEKEGGIAPQRLTASGYSFHRPVASNDTLEGRRQNRRIEIILEPVQ